MRESEVGFNFQCKTLIVKMLGMIINSMSVRMVYWSLFGRLNYIAMSFFHLFQGRFNVAALGRTQAMAEVRESDFTDTSDIQVSAEMLHVCFSYIKNPTF